MKKSIKVGSQFSGVGAFEQSLLRLGINFKNIYAADWDKYARQTYLLNFEEPEYYVKDVHDTPIEEINKKHGSLDIAMFSPPCQAFSLAGKRLGKEDKRGILFFNSLEFIQQNKPRFFIFENVKGLLSHDKKNKDADYGNTFKEWISLLGGKSVNGVYNFFPYDDAVPYHIYFQVLNAKHYGIPQNRERIFIIGIRDDEDNDFQFPEPFSLTKRLKDVLESEVDEKYFLSEKSIEHLLRHKERHEEKGTGFGVELKNEESVASTLRANAALCPTDNHIEVKYNYGRKSLNETLTNEDLPNEISIVDSYNKKIQSEFSPSILTTIDSANNHHVFVPANNSKGFDIAEEEEDSINFSVPTSETRRGRVGKKVSQTLDTQCNQGIATKKLSKQQIEKLNNLEVDENIAGCITEAIGRAGSSDEYISSVKRNAILTQRIRRLTPTECFRLMDFNEDFIEKTINSGLISDSQLYKQAGNSICVGVIAAVISKLKL